MYPKIQGFGFRVTGLILGITGAVVSAIAIVFTVIGWYKYRKFKRFQYR